MTTTTLRLPEHLKQRIVKLAEKSGMSVHNFMIEAIAQKADEAELRTAFHAEADKRFAELMKSGSGIDWHEMRTYLQTKASGRKAKPPKTRPWRA